ncbi:hypothetical protein J4Q44_G00391150, partial [Coregonus suidteri]
MSPKITVELLRQLRQAMRNTKYIAEPIQAYIVPSGDAHQSEYIAPCDCRREFICGFNGSAGIVCVCVCVLVSGSSSLVIKEVDMLRTPVNT